MNLPQSIALLKRVGTSAAETFHRMSCPNPKYIPGRFEHEIAHRRNKAVLLIQVVSFTLFIVEIIRGTGDLSSHIQGLIATTMIWAVNFISCKYHHDIFRTFYNVLLLFYTVGQAEHGHAGVVGALLGAQTFPIYVYLFTGSLWHFLGNCIGQIFMIHWKYQGKLAESLATATIDEIINSFSVYSRINFIYTLNYLILTHYILYSTYEKLAMADKEKKDFDKQKMFILGFSHELRNAINSLIGNIRLASLERISNGAKELLSNSEVCAEVLMQLVNNILDVGKAEIGDLEINPAPTNIFENIEKIWGSTLR